MAAQQTQATAKFIQDLTRKGIINEISVHNLTGVMPNELGDFILQNTQNGLSCIVYPQGNQILVCVYG